MRVHTSHRGTLLPFAATARLRDGEVPFIRYAPTLFVPRVALTVTGELQWFEKAGDSGLAVGRGFCPNCGSSLFGQAASMPELTAIRAGSLDDPSAYHPQVGIYASRAPAWDFMDPLIPKFPKCRRALPARDILWVEVCSTETST